MFHSALLFFFVNWLVKTFFFFLKKISSLQVEVYSERENNQIFLLLIGELSEGHCIFPELLVLWTQRWANITWQWLLYWLLHRSLGTSCHTVCCESAKMLFLKVLVSYFLSLHNKWGVFEIKHTTSHSAFAAVLWKVLDNSKGGYPSRFPSITFSLWNLEKKWGKKNLLLLSGEPKLKLEVCHQNLDLIAI